jgi:hypothetical protein
VNLSQIGTDGSKGRCLRAKARELWMIAVPTGAPAQHSASQKGFAPQRDQALRIEVFGMQRPEPHHDALRKALI